MNIYIFLSLFVLMLLFGLYSFFKDLNSLNYTSEHFNHELKDFPFAHEIASSVFLTGNIDSDAKKLQLLISKKHSKQPTFKFCQFLASEYGGSK